MLFYINKNSQRYISSHIFQLFRFCTEYETMFTNICTNKIKMCMYIVLHFVSWYFFNHSASKDNYRPYDEFVSFPECALP
jgi:hypothetical protein